MGFLYGLEMQMLPLKGAVSIIFHSLTEQLCGFITDVYRTMFFILIGTLMVQPVFTLLYVCLCVDVNNFWNFEFFCFIPHS